MAVRAAPKRALHRVSVCTVVSIICRGEGTRGREVGVGVSNYLTAEVFTAVRATFAGRSRKFPCVCVIVRNYLEERRQGEGMEWGGVSNYFSAA